MKKLGMYIHIPFCIKKCLYCDFCSFDKYNDDKIDEYINMLVKELGMYPNIENNYEIDSIFIGGGTPSSIDPKYIEWIINKINKRYKIDNKSEITIEINPGTITNEKADIYKQIGINRISIGVQTFNDSILKKIGRIHNSHDIFKTFEILDKYKFENNSIDLMFNLPNQNIDIAMLDIEQALKLNLKHISYYSLIIEENTPFYDMSERGELKIYDDEVDREIYYKSRNFLKENNFMQYEISNFSKKGFESKHNLKYWNRQEYIGFGISAHSFINEVRFSNTNNIEYYIKNINNNDLKHESHEKINNDERLWEYLILGLRKTKGIKITEFKDKAGTDYDKLNNIFLKLERDGLIIYGDESIKLTEIGMDLSNTVFVKLKC